MHGLGWLGSSERGLSIDKILLMRHLRSGHDLLTGVGHGREIVCDQGCSWRQI
jgi:hypothetical protein